MITPAQAKAFATTYLSSVDGFAAYVEHTIREAARRDDWPATPRVDNTPQEIVDAVATRCALAGWLVIVEDGLPISSTSRTRFLEIHKPSVLRNMQVLRNTPIRNTPRPAMFCEHANECPQSCPCDCDCYCRVEGSCQRRP